MTPDTEAVRIRVKQEFEKNPELREEDLDHIRDWMASEKHLPKVSDDMLIPFLHSCYYDLARTKSCIETYYTVRTHATELFYNRDVTKPALQKSLNTLNIAMLPVPDPNGYNILYHGLRDFDPSHYMHADANKLTYMTSDVWYKLNGTSPGLVLLIDMKGSKLAHITKLSLSTLRVGSKYIHDGSPVRLKSVHVINCVTWVDKMMSILKPFVRQEILSLFHYYQSDNLEALYEHIPRECLPSDFGGTLASLEKLVEENSALLASMRDFFEEDERLYRVDETKRDKKKKNKKDTVELPTETAFKKLEID